MKKYLILVFLSCLAFTNTQASELKPYVMPSTFITPIKDTVSDRQYELYIKLPQGYAEDKGKKYPVIYITDAVWHIEVLSTSTPFLMPDAILVGISWQRDISKEWKKALGEYASRYRDYNLGKSDNAEEQALYQFGGADKHLDFIRKDVIPFVENNYRTAPENRTYFGYSIGGTFGAYTLMKHPDTFKNYLLGSPSLWGEVSLLSELGAKHKNLNANVLITFGSEEYGIGKSALDFMRTLEKREDKTLTLKLEVIDGDHGTAFPTTGVNSIKWLSSIQK